MPKCEKCGQDFLTTDWKNMHEMHCKEGETVKEIDRLRNMTDAQLNREIDACKMKLSNITKEVKRVKKRIARAYQVRKERKMEDA